MAGEYALMWSGGKDSALALQRVRTAGLDVTCLLNFYDSKTERVRFHATTVAMIEAQAAALGLELHATGSSWEAMPEALGDRLRRLRAEGFRGVVLGDIHLADVRAWYEERVTAAGLEHVEPLWGVHPSNLLREFVTTGGRAVVTCVDLDRLDSTWLGRVIDVRFAEDIAATGVDACGENGEYHSFVFDGPMFLRPVPWRPGEARTEGRFSQLDLLPAQP
jgi:uncharacterized protein (TIGR00290 family)